MFIHAVARWWCFRQHGRLSGRCGAGEANGFLLWCSDLMRVVSAIVPQLCGPSRSESMRHTFCDLKVGRGCYRSLGNWAPAHATCTDASSVSSALGPGMRQPGAWSGRLLWLYTWTSSLSRTKAASISGDFEPCQSPAQLFPVDIKAGAWTQQGFTKTVDFSKGSWI